MPLDDVFDDVPLGEAEPVLEPVQPVLEVVVLRKRQVAAPPLDLDLRLGQPGRDLGDTLAKGAPLQRRQRPGLPLRDGFALRNERSPSRTQNLVTPTFERERSVKEASIKWQGPGEAGKDAVYGAATLRKLKRGPSDAPPPCRARSDGSTRPSRPPTKGGGTPDREEPELSSFRKPCSTQAP